MKSIFAFLFVLPLIANARVQLDVNCTSSLKSGDDVGVIQYGHMILDSEKVNAQIVQDFNLDKAFYSITLAKTGELQGGGETFRLILARVEDDQEVLYSKKPKVKGQLTSSASVKENGGIVSTVWLDQNVIDKKTKKPTLVDTFPAQLKIAYNLKTGIFSRQNIKVTCDVQQKTDVQASPLCEGEAQILSGDILSTNYIAGVGCKAQVANLIRVQSNPMCSSTLFDVDIVGAGLVVTPPSADGCTAKAGDKITGVAERHGSHIYLFTPQKAGTSEVLIGE